MSSEVIGAGDACRLIGQLEQLLEMPVAAVVCATGGAELTFVMPGEADKAYLRQVLRWIATAAQDASKSL